MLFRRRYMAKLICDPTPRAPQLISVIIIPSPAFSGDVAQAGITWNGFPRDADISFQWLRYGNEIPDATEAFYTITDFDVGPNSLTVSVFIDNGLGTDYGLSAEVTVYPREEVVEFVFDGSEQVFDGVEPVEDAV